MTERLPFLLISFLGSFLLFQIELIMAKLLLPGFGGSFYVWTTCMMFYTGVLFLGYAYAHAVMRFFSVRTYARLHTLLVFIATLFLPIAMNARYGEFHPVARVILILTQTIGIPFFVLSTTAPVIQRWFSLSKDRDRGRPYFLYSASNLGAFLALLSYPFFFEPQFDITEQLRIWYGLYAAYALAHLFCLPSWGEKAVKSSVEAKIKKETIGTYEKMYWLMSSAAACAWMLAATSTLTLDIASVPLLWMFPLGIYLVTLILNFKQKPWYPSYLNIICLTAISILVVVLTRSPAGIHTKGNIVTHGLTLFTAAMICHRNLYRAKPVDTRHLTAYYLYISLGGWLASVVLSVGIPFLARRLAMVGLDYAVVAVFFLGSLLLRDRKAIAELFRRHKPVGLVITAGLVLGLAVAVVMIRNIEKRNAIFTLRNFYGIYKIKEEKGFREFIHGSTVHGKQFLDPAKQDTPLLYYHPEGPVGDIFNTDKRSKNVGVIGLGVGALSAYAKKGERWDIYELDPDVVDLAKTYFTHLGAAKADMRIITGDGRLSLAEASDARYDIFVVDAFSSDSIPTHLITREALALYASKVMSDGLIAFNISNRYLNLKPVLAALAESLQMPAAYKGAGGNAKESEFPSSWFVIGRSEEKINKLKEERGWQDASVFLGGRSRRVWTDRYVNILSALLD